MRYGPRNVFAVRRANKSDREYFFEDLRQAEGRNSREIKILVALFGHLRDLHESSPDKTTKFTEMDIPRAMIA